MKSIVFALSLLATAAFCNVAKADTTLSTDQLIKSIQNSVNDCKANQPDMANAITGLRVSGIGTNAQVIIEMNSSGMTMNTKYICVPAGNDMNCNMQQ